MLSANNTSTNKKEHFFITILADGQVFSNYLNIMYNKNLLLMPTIFTTVSEQTSTNLSFYKAQNQQCVININDYENGVKKINTSSHNTYFLFNSHSVYWDSESKALIDNNKALVDNNLETPFKYKRIALSIILFSCLLLSANFFISAMMANDEKSIHNNTIFGILTFVLAIATQQTNDFFTGLSKRIKEPNTQYSQDTHTYRAYIHESQNIYAYISFDASINRSTGSLPTYPCQIFKVYLLNDKDPKIIIPKYIKNHCLNQLNIKKHDPISVSAYIQIGSKVISEFHSDNIEFNDKIKDCVFLSSGTDMSYVIDNNSNAFILSAKPFPIIYKSSAKYVPESKFPDTQSMVAEQIFRDGQMDEISALLSFI